MKNWKTTLIGLLAALWVVAQPIIQRDDFDLQKDWKSLVYALFIAAFGFVAKDFNVTGNPAKTIGQDVPDKAAKV